MTVFPKTGPGFSESGGPRPAIADLPNTVVQQNLGGGAHAQTPTVYLDSYYDNATFASKSAAINAAVAAVQAVGGTLEFKHGRVYSLDTAALQIAPGAAIRINGNKATLQSNWTKPRCIDFTRTADYQTFQSVEINDLTFDANNITSASNESIVGNLLSGGGVNTQRSSFQDVFIRRCKWINVPYGTSVHYTCLALCSGQPSGDVTQTTILNVRVEQALMRGGNNGATVFGIGLSGATSVDVYLDRIYVDVDHDTLNVPTTSGTGANVQIGGIGWGDRCEVHIIGANSQDVGVEIDGMQDGHVWGRVTDAFNANFFCRNFANPQTGGVVTSQTYLGQRVWYHGCEGRTLNVSQAVSGGGASTGFQVGHTSAPNPTFGEAVLENCSYYSAATQFEIQGTALKVITSALVSAVTIVGKFRATYDKINDSTTPVNGAAIFINPGSTNFTLGGGGDVEITLSGTLNGAAAKANGLIVVPQGSAPGTGCAMRIDLGDVTINPSLAGMPNASLIGCILELSGSSGGSMRGHIRRLGWGTYASGDTTPRLLMVAPSTHVTISGHLEFDELDLSQDPAAAPAFHNAGGFGDIANRARTTFKTINYPGVIIPSAAPAGATNFATTNFTTAVGNQYVGGLAADVQFATGTGAAVTAIDASKDNVTYENIWTQASGALTQSVVVPVENGDYVRQTFATTQATGRVRYKRS